MRGIFLTRVVLDRVLDAEAFCLHFSTFVETYNFQNECELKVNIRGIHICRAYLEDALLARYDHFERADLVLVYRSVVADIAFMMYALMDEIFPPNLKGNFTDARHVVFFDYFFGLLHEATDQMPSRQDLSNDQKVRAGRRFK